MRWLHPAFQNPLAKTELLAQVQQALEVDLASNPVTATATTQSWPSTLPEPVKAVAQLLVGAPGPLTLAQIQASFSGGGGSLKSHCRRCCRPSKPWVVRSKPSLMAALSEA